MDNRRPVFDARVAYVYSDLPSYARAKKTLVTLRELFREVHFIGSRRRRKWDEARPGGITYHINPRVLGTGLETIPGVARHIRFIRSRLARIRPDVVIAVNEEYILPFAAGVIEKPPVLVLDLYDSVAMRILGRAAKLRPLWRGLSALAMLTADALVEVNEDRLAWQKLTPPLTAVVYNSPPALADLTPMTGLPSQRFLYVSGTMEDRIHGLEILLAAVDRVPEIEVVVTGKPSGDWVEREFLTHPRVHFLGLVPYEDVPRIAAASLGVFAHYSPVRLNYIYGAPNKLYEAMQAGVPVLINRENKAHREAVKLGFGIVSPYGDAGALARDLRRLLNRDSELTRGCERARRAFAEHYAWDVMARERYLNLFRQLGVPTSRQ